MENDEHRARRLKKEGTLHPYLDRVRSDLIAKSRFFDANDLMQMKYEMLRSVSVDQQPIAKAAYTFGLSRVAYYHAQKQYQQHGLAGLLPHRRGPKRPHKFTPEVMSFIDEHLRTTGGRPDWNFLSKQIEDRFGAKVHPRSVSKMRGLNNYNVAILQHKFQIQSLHIIPDPTVAENSLTII